MKKIIVVVLATVSASLVLIGVLMIQLFLMPIENPITANLPEREGSECYYGEGFQDYTDYCKYYYPKDSNIVEKLQENKYFQLVTADDVEEIRSYFEDFEGWVRFEEYRDNYDFQHECVDTSDYFYIENKDTYEKYKDYPDKYSAYNVYFFDVQTCILYFIHLNL